MLNSRIPLSKTQVFKFVFLFQIYKALWRSDEKYLIFTPFDINFSGETVIQTKAKLYINCWTNVQGR